MRARAATGLLALLLLCAGCQSALDLERARELFRGRAEPAVPSVGDVEVALPAPKGLRVTSDQLRQVPLRWDPILTSDVAGYVVERAPADGGDFERIATLPGRFETVFVDRGSDLARKQGATQRSGLGDGEAYRYRLRAFDSAGAVGATPSEALRVETAAPPSSPDDLRAYSYLPLRVALSWSPVDDPTASGYVLYRSPSAGGEFREIGRIEGAFRTTYVDRGLGALRVLYYRVATLNAAGGEGEASPPVRAVTKPEPLPPVGLSVEAQGLGWNQLRWEPNVEEDVAGYRVVRQGPGEEEARLVAEVAPDELQAEDRAVAARESLEYRVYAFDADGLESAASDPLQVEGVGYGLRAEPGSGGVLLRWDAALAQELSAARVIRRGRLRDRELARVEGDRYFDQAVEPGRRYRYRLVGIRGDGSEAPASRELEVEVPARDAGIAASP